MAEENGNSINVKAAEFAARRDAANPDQQDDAELESWLAEDSRHLGAYMRAVAVLAYAKRAGGAVAGFDPDNPAFRQSIRDQSRKRIPARAWIAAAAVLCLVMLTVPLLLRIIASEPEYRTAVGEMRVIPLADGSTVTLNTSTRVKVRFSGSMREVVLENGEAFFDVARDPDRPFTIRAGHADAQVVGTKFNLRRFGGGAVSLIVKEGAVDFSRGAGGTKEVRRVNAGTTARAAPSAPMDVEAISADALDRATVWREGMMFFDGTSLSDAVREFKRYNQAPVLIIEPALADHAVSGYFSSRDPAGFAEAVAETMGLEIDRSERIIFMKSRK